MKRLFEDVRIALSAASGMLGYLKVSGEIDWSWAAVTAPLWGPVVLGLLLVSAWIVWCLLVIAAVDIWESFR